MKSIDRHNLFKEGDKSPLLAAQRVELSANPEFVKSIEKISKKMF